MADVPRSWSAEVTNKQTVIIVLQSDAAQIVSIFILSHLNHIYGYSVIKVVVRSEGTYRVIERHRGKAF